jgi:hypothetical protein
MKSIKDDTFSILLFFLNCFIITSAFYGWVQFYLKHFK